MATTGYFEQQAGGNTQQQKWALRLEYSYDTNAAGTITTITWTLKVYDGTGESWNGDGSAYYWITAWSGNQYLSYHYYGVGWQTLGTFTDTYSRTPGEARTITADAAWYSGLSSNYTPSSISISESLTFPAVAGATTPTIGAVTFGSAATISLPRASSSFTHDLTYKFGSATGTIATGAGTSASWTPTLSLASQIPSAVSGTGTITCTTYNGSTEIGTKTISFTASVPASVVPTITDFSLTRINTVDYLVSQGIYVAGYSKVGAHISAAGAYGSTITRATVSVDGKTYNGPDITSDMLQTAGTLSVVTNITDSRGRTAAATRTITVQPYARPTISSLTYQRGTYSGGVWTASDQGEDVKVTFTLGLSLTAYSNAASLSVAVDGETTQTTTGAAAGAKIYYFTTIGTDVTRKLTVIATDSTGTAATASADIPTIKVLANVNVDLNSLRVGGVAENADTFRCSLDAKFDKNVSVSGVISGRLANQWDWDYLHENTSLNAYTDLGMYANATTSECSTITNTPSDMPIGEMFLLVVPMGATNYKAQILIGKNGVTFSVYLRVLNGTTWSDWKKMAL